MQVTVWCMKKNESLCWSCLIYCAAICNSSAPSRRWAFLPVGAPTPESGMRGTQEKPPSPAYSGSLNKTHCCKRRELGCLVYKKLTHLLSVYFSCLIQRGRMEGTGHIYGISLSFISYINRSFIMFFLVFKNAEKVYF